VSRNVVVVVVVERGIDYLDKIVVGYGVNCLIGVAIVVVVVVVVVVGCAWFDDMSHHRMVASLRLELSRDFVVVVVVVVVVVDVAAFGIDVVVVGSYHVVVGVVVEMTYSLAFFAC
jgi:hypothetical protein